MKFLNGNLKECQKKVPELLLHQTVVLLACIYNFEIAVKFEGNYLKQDKVYFFRWKCSNSFFFVYELSNWSCCLGTDFTLKGFLFRGVKLTLNEE